MADADRPAAVERTRNAAGSVGLVNLPDYLDDVVRPLADAIPTPGPWHYERDPVERGGGLVLYDAHGEPVALVYGGLPVALYLQAVAPDRLLRPPS